MALRCFGLPLLCIANLALAQHQESVASLGKDDVDMREVSATLKGLPPAQKAKLATEPEALEELLWQKLAWKRLVRESHAANWAEQPSVKPRVDAAVRELAERISATAYLQEQSKAPATYPSEAELQEAYERLDPPPAAPITYEVAQIFLKRPAKESGKAMEAFRAETESLAALARGGDFGALAKQHSQDATTAFKGGVLPKTTAEQMRPSMRKVITRLAVGEVSEPADGLKGVYIFKLISRQEARALSLTEVTPILKQQLRTEFARRKEREYLERIAPRTAMRINMEAAKAALGELR